MATDASVVVVLCAVNATAAFEADSSALYLVANAIAAEAVATDEAANAAVAVATDAEAANAAEAVATDAEAANAAVATDGEAANAAEAVATDGEAANAAEAVATDVDAAKAAVAVATDVDVANAAAQVSLVAAQNAGIGLAVAVTGKTAAVAPGWAGRQVVVCAPLDRPAAALTAGGYHQRTHLCLVHRHSSQLCWTGIAFVTYSQTAPGKPRKHNPKLIWDQAHAPRYCLSRSGTFPSVWRLISPGSWGRKCSLGGTQCI